MSPIAPTFPALILAGEDPGHPSRLALDEGVAAKSLIEVGGRPMLTHVLAAAQESPRVGAIAVAGVEPGRIEVNASVTWLPGGPSLVDNALAGIRHLGAGATQPAYVLILTGDTPLLTATMLTWFIDACAPYTRDLYYGIVRRATVEEHFPQSRRTYLRTREGRFCGGDLFLVRPEVALALEPKLRALVANRKSVRAQIRLLGVGWVIRLALGLLHLDGVVAGVERYGGITGKAVILPFADAAMDVDKPLQLAMVRAALARRSMGAR